jgi:hypothetical protein
MTIVTVSPDLSFPDLAIVVQQQEELLGPLVRLGTSGDATLLEFDEQQDPPRSPTVLVPADSPSELTAGSRPALGGEVFINRQARRVFAYRPAG